MDGGLRAWNDSSSRGFRPRQKGIECNIDGCSEWRVSNDLCPKHNIQRLRRSNKKYRNYVKDYNKRYKRKDIDKVCEVCKEDFVTARKNQYLCSKCSGSKKGNRKTQEHHGDNEIQKATYQRDGLRL